MDDRGISNQLQITKDEYNAFCLFLEQTTGIVLGADKLYLVNSRLGNIMTTNGISSMTALIEKLKKTGESKLKELIVDAMTTNETNWFRDVYPYSILVEKILPQYRQKDHLRIWSAACSTGQEPYSISICISEYVEKISWFPFANIVKLLATDISISVLERAKKGEFNVIEMERGISKVRQQRFFDQINTGKYKLKETELSRVVFQPFNLLSGFVSLGKFDIIFCRNALIYFSPEVKVNIINKFAEILNKGGYLFLGSSESMPQQCSQFQVINCQPGIVYQKL